MVHLLLVLLDAELLVEPIHPLDVDEDQDDEGDDRTLLGEPEAQRHPENAQVVQGLDEEDPRTTKATGAFWAVIAQIAVIDLVFSLDSVITAVGIAEHIPIMVFAILLAVAIMLLAANPLGAFIDANPTVKMLALAFILLIGVVLILDGLDAHVPKPYIYFAMGFSVLVEWLNLLMRRKAQQHRVPGAGKW